MERIAAGRLIIEQDSTYWRLVFPDGGESGRTLFSITQGSSARYDDLFARQRGLPLGGVIAPEQVDRVVVGWSGRDHAWYLGLMLESAPGDARSSRWCGLASWNDPDGRAFETTAQHAGQSLAHKLARPIAIVPPKPLNGAPAPDAVRAPMPPMTAPIDTSEVRQPIPQPPLPLMLDDWTLERIDGRRVELRLKRAWVRARFLRAGWYIILTGIFALLTITTFISGIAMPRPEFLAWMGVASVVVMTLGVLVTLGRAIRQPKRIVFDGAADRVVWLRGQSIAGEVPPGMVEAVYISHVVGKVGKRATRPNRPVRFGEINLLLTNGEFVHVLTASRMDENIPTTDDPLDEEHLVPLTSFNARTRLQSAALAIAETLNRPAVYDKRV
jgi:hypothetical protein